MGTAIDILLLERDDTDVVLIRRFLESQENEYTLTHESGFDDGLRRLSERSYDIVLVDCSLPDAPDGDAFGPLRRQYPAVALVALTGTANEQGAVEAVRQGAQDYLVKGRINGSALWRVISYAIERNRLSAQLREYARELENGKQSLRHLIDTSVDGMVVVGDNNGVLYVNQAAEEILDQPQDQLVGQAFGFRYQIGEATEITVCHANGDARVAEMRSTETLWEGAKAFLVALRDMTERKAAEKAVQQSEQRLELALHGANLGLWDWNVAERQIVVNQRWAEIHGCELSDVSADLNPWETLVEEEDRARVREALEGHLEGSRPFYESEHRLTGNPDAARWVFERGKVVERDGNGSPVRLTGTSLDISLRKQADEKLAQARKYEIEVESQIEKSLLRGQVPHGIRGASVAVLSSPSRHMAGDFYDILTYQSHCFDVLIGDVMGKGIVAALIGAGTKNHFLWSLSNLMATGTGRDLPDLKSVVAHVHAEVTPRLIELEQFLTLHYARFDLDAARVDFVDCGHTRTIHYRSGKRICQILEGNNLPIGVDENEGHEQFSQPLGAGDVLLYYSDGVTEARNDSGEMYGMARLLAFVEERHFLEPEDLVQGVRREVAEFSGSETFADDFTCIAVSVDTVGHPDRMKLKINASTGDLVRVRNFARMMCEQHPGHGFNELAIAQFQLAAHEAVANVIEHVYKNRSDHEILLAGEVEEDRITLRVYQEGKKFDMESAQMPDLDVTDIDLIPDRGRGIFIIRESVDEFKTEQISPSMACLSLVKYAGKQDRPKYLS